MSDPSQDSILPACSVLLVEDEIPAAMELEAMLKRAGAGVVYTASSLGQASRILDREDVSPEVAVLDINIGGQLVYPLAEKLRDAGTAIIFVTGYSDATQISPEYDEYSRLEKPFSEADLLQAIHTALAEPPHFS